MPLGQELPSPVARLKYLLLKAIRSVWFDQAEISYDYGESYNESAHRILGCEVYSLHGGSRSEKSQKRAKHVY